MTNIVYNGKEYQSFKALCHSENINNNAFYSAKNKNKSWSIAQVLEFCKTHQRTQPHDLRKSEYKNADGTFHDHEGRVFKSLGELLRFHGICYATFYDRIYRGLSLKEVLTITVVGKISTDHKGQRFATFAEMCRFYKKNPCTVIDRIKKGASLQDALTRRKIYYDK